MTFESKTFLVGEKLIFIKFFENLKIELECYNFNDVF